MTDLPIEAGPDNGDSAPELIDAINQVFGLFEINYHNQFYSAFSHNSDQLNEVKRLWLNSLNRFPPALIMQAAKTLIESSEYLPTLNKMIRACGALIEGAAPDAHSAYLEACRAPSPKNAYSWSHPAVYHAGKSSDWYFLSTTAEAIAFPIFKNHYNRLVDEIRAGAHLEIPHMAEAGPAAQENELDKPSAMEKISAIRNELNSER